MSPGPLGVVANPVSGKDVRRLVAFAATSTLAEKVSVVRRVLVGAAEHGAERFVVLPEPHGICARAARPLALEVEELELALCFDESDTVRAAGALKRAGCGAVVVLGGDGTNRAVALGWPDAPLVSLSTGTNNVFPAPVEPTVAGAAAGLLASGRVALEAVAERAKVVRVEVEGEADDLALVDAVLVDERFVGSRALFDPGALRVAVLARAEPASVGISSIGGLLRPCGAAEDAGVLVRLGPRGRRLRAALAPGLYASFGIEVVASLVLGEAVELRGPGLLALDGERKRVLRPGQRAVLSVLRDGPWVVDVGRAMREVAGAGGPEATTSTAPEATTSTAPEATMSTAPEGRRRP